LRAGGTVFADLTERLDLFHKLQWEGDSGAAGRKENQGHVEEFESRGQGDRPLPQPEHVLRVGERGTAKTGGGVHLLQERTETPSPVFHGQNVRERTLLRQQRTHPEGLPVPQRSPFEFEKSLMSKLPSNPSFFIILDSMFLVKSLNSLFLFLCSMTFL